MRPSPGSDPADPFVLGDAPFWPVDHLAEPDPWAGHIPFAFWIIQALRPRRLVELGTHSGNSYLAFAQAVQRLGLGTACFAVDTWRGDDQAGHYGEEVFRELSRYHDARYGAFSRLVRSTFDEAVQHFPDGGIDLLHVDGYHTYEAVARDFTTWRPKLSSQAVVLFHDVNVREGGFGVWRLWEELRGTYPHFEFLHSHGLGVLGVGDDLPAAVSALLRTGPDEVEASRIRQIFARLGGPLPERLRFEALHSEIGRLTEALRAADQRELIDGLRQTNNDQLRLISGLQHEIVRLGKLRETELRRAEQERAALTALHQSLSFRLTRPLRLAGGWSLAVVAWARRGARSP